MRTLETELNTYFTNVEVNYPYWVFSYEGQRYKISSYIYGNIFKNADRGSVKSEILNNKYLIKL